MSKGRCLIIFALIGMAEAIMDLSCTKRIGDTHRYDESAVNCDDYYPESICIFMFGNAVKQDQNIERNARCFQNPTTKQVDNNLVHIATQSCPKTCGYCCKTPEFNCENVKSPRIDCGKVTKEQCRNQLWKPILIEDCPNVCGFCLASDCKDIAPDCGADPGICSRKGMQNFVEAYCQRTCNLCKSTNSVTKNPLNRAAKSLHNITEIAKKN